MSQSHSRCPAHVTLRARHGLPSLRRRDVFDAVKTALALTTTARFRLLQFNVHLLVEAEAATALQGGVQGLAIRVAKAVNRVLRRRGRVWGDRYHALSLTTPREVRHALVYVLQNWRKHFGGVSGLDPRSSAAWFGSWRISMTAPAEPSPVAPPRTWLARAGWRRHGLVGTDETPRRGFVH